MANPNPFLFADPPPAADNPFLDTGSAEVNPFMAQQVPQQGFGYQGHQGHFGQVEQANPFADPYNSMGHGGPASMGYAGHGPASMMYYGQQQQGQFNQFGQQQFGQQAQGHYNQMGHMAHMNTHTNSVASGAAAFGVSHHDPAAAFGVGAAAFGVTSAPAVTGVEAFGVTSMPTASGAAAFGVTEYVAPSSDSVSNEVAAFSGPSSPPVESTGNALFGVESSSTMSEAPSAVDIKSPPEVSESSKSTGAALFGVAEPPGDSTTSAAVPAVAENPFMLDDPLPPPPPVHIASNFPESDTAVEKAPSFVSNGEVTVNCKTTNLKL